MCTNMYDMDNLTYSNKHLLSEQLFYCSLTEIISQVALSKCKVI